MKLTILIVLAAFMCETVMAWPAKQSDFYDRAREQARLLPVRPLGERKITIDGKLDDWGDMRQDSFVIHQLLDHTLPEFHQSWKAQWENEPIDAALIKLAYDQEALYIAVRVADDSVVSPATNRLSGDVVDIYLDLRPLTGDGPALGHVKYTEGVYQIVCAPPTADLPLHCVQPDGEVFTDWKPGQKVPRLGPYEAKGAKFNGGYSIEIRIPLASFPHKPAPDRLTQPIGFEVMIADQDAARPKGQPERLFYSCSGYSGGRDYFKSPYMMACTDPELRTGLPLSRQRNNPLKLAPGGDEPEGWTITDIGEKPAAAVTTYPCKALGLAFHHRRVLARLPASAPASVGNRYAAVFPAEGVNVKVDGDLSEWTDFERTASSIHEFGNLPFCTGLPGRTDSARVKLITANDTLFVGIRVKDDSVIKVGDGVQVFLDVRSPIASTNPMSTGSYSDGVYNFQVSPPTDDGKRAELRQGSQPVRKAGPIEFASARQPDGYTVELAIPLSSLQDQPATGRFQQPFGFEVLVSDLDKPNADALMLTYSWGSFSESALQSGPQWFSCADYVPNRLPEIRALVDSTPVHITTDFTRPLQSVTGFGGNLFRDAEPGPHGGGSMPGQYGPGKPGTLYVAEHLDPAWINMNVSLYNWGDPADPKRFGTWTPGMWSIGDRVKAKTLAPMDGTPIDHIFHAQEEGTDSHGVWNKSIIDWFLISVKPWARPDTRLCFYVDKMPLDRLAGGGKPLPRDAWPSYAECVTSYMAYAKKAYGIEFAYFAFKNVPWGAYQFEPPEYLEMLKFLGESFEKQGFKTKLLLCDSDSPMAYRWYGSLAHEVARDVKLQQYVGAVGIEIGGPLETNLATYRLWGDLATHANKPLLITSVGRPYAASSTYLFEELRMWQQVMSELQPTGMLVRQFVSEKSNKWLMVFDRQVVRDKDRAFSVLQVDNVPKRVEDALPAQRFWFAKHFCDLTPVGHAIATTSDHPRVLATAVAGTRGGRHGWTLHLSNAGAARQATISGLPDSVMSLRVIRSGAGEGFVEGDRVKLVKGTATLELPAWSLVSLTTIGK